ncbi:hypothetical protein FACS1894132_05540 [Clostridia bacterium]|nr:hypothetical protein FACS1894132_05540 [Clostridia bacterium]
MEKSTLVRSKTTEMKIGKVNYIVTTHCNPSGRETAEQKYLRYVTERVAEELKAEIKPILSSQLS